MYICHPRWGPSHIALVQAGHLLAVVFLDSAEQSGRERKRIWRVSPEDVANGEHVCVCSSSKSDVEIDSVNNQDKVP